MITDIALGIVLGVVLLIAIPVVASFAWRLLLEIVGEEVMPWIFAALVFGGGIAILYYIGTKGI